jgi:hypothetical protein
MVMKLLLAAALLSSSLIPDPLVTLPPPKGKVTLAWNPALNAAGYKVYQGVGSLNYTNVAAAGSVLSVTVSNLNLQVTNYFAATAYNASGVESDYSTELVLLPPPPPTNVFTFSVAIVGTSNLTTLYMVTNLPAFSLTNPPDCQSFKALMSVSVTNIAK